MNRQSVGKSSSLAGWMTLVFVTGEVYKKIVCCINEQIRARFADSELSFKTYKDPLLNRVCQEGIQKIQRKRSTHQKIT